jgi:hypothetical protein
MKTIRLLFVNFALLLAGCSEPGPPSYPPGSFGSEVAFLSEHTDVVVLSNASGSAQVALVPSMQGRIMTSTLGGPSGLSLGWINHELIASGDTLPHINPYGGEDRFWLGPEGGQFAIFFKPGDPFDFDHWFTPAPIDTEPFELVSSSDSQAVFKKSASFLNYSGTEFEVEIDRRVRMLDRTEAQDHLDVDIAESVQMVAFESDNTILNSGEAAWTPESGLLSIWILGMFNPSPSTTVVIPFVTGDSTQLGPIVNDAYFGKVPDDRLVIGDGVLYFKGDGEYRGKIGLSPERAKSILGSYDAENEVLTIAQFSKPVGASRYVNSMWELQEEPYGGDVSNSYNDGPLEGGAKGLGPFYELETSSPAAALAPGETQGHIHRTFHFHGPRETLSEIARSTLGVTLAEIENGLP